MRADNSFVMSMPYQNAVVKIGMDSGEIKWILGTPDNWKEPWSEKLLKLRWETWSGPINIMPFHRPAGVLTFCSITVLTGPVPFDEGMAT